MEKSETNFLIDHIIRFQTVYNIMQKKLSEKFSTVCEKSEKDLASNLCM